MGLFNNVPSKMPCSECPAPVEWQSKSLAYKGFLLANVMHTIPLDENVDGEMYTSCSNCGAFIDADIEHGEVVRVKVSCRDVSPSERSAGLIGIPLLSGLVVKRVLTLDEINALRDGP